MHQNFVYFYKRAEMPQFVCSFPILIWINLTKVVFNNIISSISFYITPVKIILNNMTTSFSPSAMTMSDLSELSTPNLLYQNLLCQVIVNNKKLSI